MRGDDQAGAGRRVEELRLDDPRENEIAERAVSLPTLVAVLDESALRRRSGIEVGQFGEPVEARGPVPRAIPAVGLLEVVGKRPRVGFREAKSA